MHYTTTKSSIAQQYKQLKCIPSNIDIFLIYVPYLHNCHAIDDLSSNHLPIELTLQMHKISNRQVNNTITDWSTYVKLCSKKKINPNLPTTATIDTEIKNLYQLINNSYRIATRPQTIQNINSTIDLLLYNPIKERNRQRRNYQKTGNSLHELKRNILTTAIQKRIVELKNQKWQDKQKPTYQSYQIQLTTQLAFQTRKKQKSWPKPLNTFITTHTVAFPYKKKLNKGQPPHNKHLLHAQ